MLDRHLPIHPLRTPHDFEEATDDKRQPQLIRDVPLSEDFRELGVKRAKTLMQGTEQPLAAFVESEVVEDEVGFFRRDAFAYDVEQLEGVVEFLLGQGLQVDDRCAGSLGFDSYR